MQFTQYAKSLRYYLTRFVFNIAHSVFGTLAILQYCLGIWCSLLDVNREVNCSQLLTVTHYNND